MTGRRERRDLGRALLGGRLGGGRHRRSTGRLGGGRRRALRQRPDRLEVGRGQRAGRAGGQLAVLVEVFVDHPRADLGLGTDLRDRLAAGLAGLRVALTEARQVADGRLGREERGHGVDAGALLAVLAGVDRQDQQHERDPECASEKKEHGCRPWLSFLLRGRSPRCGRRIRYARNVARILQRRVESPLSIFRNFETSFRKIRLKFYRNSQAFPRAVSRAFPALRRAAKT